MDNNFLKKIFIFLLFFKNLYTLNNMNIKKTPKKFPNKSEY